LIVGRVIREDGGAVERAVFFWEVEPAFVADAFRPLAADTNANDVRAGVEETSGEGDERLVAHHFDEGVDAHGVDEFGVANCFAIGQMYEFVVCVYALDGTVGAELSVLFGESFGDCDPDGACPTVGWEAEGCVGTPVAGGLLQDDIFGHGLEVWGGYSLAEPLALHLGRVRRVFVEYIRPCSPSLLVLPRPCSCTVS